MMLPEVETSQNGRPSSSRPADKRTPAPAGAAPLSFGQRRLWFLDQLDPGLAAYHIPCGMRLRGPLNVPALEAALLSLVDRHEILRTIYPSTDGVPRQEVLTSCSIVLEREVRRGVAEADRDAFVIDAAADDADRPFDLARGPLIRTRLVELGDDDHGLILTQHHIASDGWSVSLLLRELSVLYTAHVRGEDSPLAPSASHYREYAAWQLESASADSARAQLEQQLLRLRGAEAELELPFDHPRPAMQSYRGATHYHVLPSELLAELKSFARSARSTLFMTVLAGYLALLSRHSGQKDLCVGTAVAGRNRLEWENILGLFINTVAIRADLSGKPSFREAVVRARAAAIAAFAGQEVPFERLVEELRPERSTARSPLFQTMFLLQSYPRQPWEFIDLEARRLTVPPRWSAFDLSLTCTERETGLECRWEYSRDLFEPDTVSEIAEQLETLLRGALLDLDRPVGRIPLHREPAPHVRPEPVIEQPLNEPADSVLTLFDRQVATCPERTAVEDLRGNRLSYRQLSDTADRAAAHLRAAGVGPNTLAAVFVNRSCELVVALLAIWKAGAAYLPLDPILPATAIRDRLHDSGASLVIADIDLPESSLPPDVTVISLGALLAARPTEKQALHERLEPQQLAYAIYTSGSTGRPKAVEIPHGALGAFLIAMRETLGMSGDECVAAITTVTFDISVLELFLPLVCGARVLVLPAQVARDPQALGEMLAGTATGMQATPATWGMLKEFGWSPRPGFRALCGGEAMPASIARWLCRAGAEVWNLYGPTETTIWSSAHCVAGTEASAIVPIGQPIPGTQAYVLDDDGEPALPGARGELYLGGAGVALGYRGRPELTAEKFRPDPFSEIPGSRMYQTGDLARRKRDGTLEFLGRSDHQVKVRGFRIEPGEVEDLLRGHPSVGEAAVVASGEETARALVAYVVDSPGQSASPDELRTLLRNRLPEYMVPSRITRLPEMPRSPGGKIDRKSLLALALPEEPLNMPAAPRDILERGLLEIWRELLPGRAFGLDDSFFDVGGHSLLAVQLMARLEGRYFRRVPLSVLFRASSISALAQVLRSGDPDSGWTSLVPIQTAGRRPPLFCVHAIGGGVLSYRSLARSLGSDQPVYGLQAALLSGGDTYFSIPQMASHYLKELRQVQPSGPYHLAGHSIGGVIALEIGRRLLAEGETVGLLGLLDTYASGYPRYQSVAARLAAHARNLHDLDGPQRKEYVNVRLNGLREKLQVGRKVTRFRAAHHQGFLPQALEDIGVATRIAARAYEWRSYPGRVTLFRAAHQPTGCCEDPYNGWGQWAEGGVDVVNVPGEHGSLVEEPHVAVLAARLSERLARGGY